MYSRPRQRKFGALAVGGDYSKLAQSLNVDSRRVSNPSDIARALKEAVDAVEAGRPYLLEIVAKEGYDFSRYSMDA